MVERAMVNVDLSDLNVVIGGIERRVDTFPMSLISEGLANAIDEHIQSEGEGEWDPLSPTTLALRPRRIGGMLLQDRGLLGNIQTTEGPDWAEAASPAPYAGFHITGTKHMVARDWTDIDLEMVLEQFAEEVLEYAVQT